MIWFSCLLERVGGLLRRLVPPWPAARMITSHQDLAVGEQRRGVPPRAVAIGMVGRQVFGGAGTTLGWPPGRSW